VRWIGSGRNIARDLDLSILLMLINAVLNIDTVAAK